ncbi:Protein N-acetyltransferase, RimJ/RimL family [Microbulbifer donghaiensis]|uniref:Protein N-acetyltransferase, RimJ/RimL family n=1 Tax=Microbulbifer donghaiensis TaxID=494016 RepID=A0A1M4YEP6_9GAMM|nr:GNAT family N-acetyltransferase [Microbulbifer donghaiensis]SHF04073.1 Protein N-acetyltransferase, RimJ/RimL family [Microbulbifer donghaiensis]
MFQLETPRLVLSELTEKDAPLMLAVLNDPDFLRNVGDRGVRTEADARRYIVDGPMAMYRQYGFGMYKVELKDSKAIGLCGLVKRDGLDDVDIGFAFLPQYRSQGYALEAAQAVMHYGQAEIGLKRIVAIALPDNVPSVRLLEKIGLQPEKRITLPNSSEELLLMAWDAAFQENQQ